MFNQQFIAELVKPQKMYTIDSVREIFNKLAHSSIMRLSTSSMDKLYDLMVMGFKHSVLSCSQPQELLQVTLNHLDAIELLVEGANDAQQCIESAINSITNIATHCGIYDYHLIRHRLCSFFQDKNIKVSLFLSAGFQNRADGSFILDLGGQCPYGFDVPGAVKYYSGSSVTAESITHPLETMQISTANFLDTSTRNSDHGKNL
jgi:hypothetical protein